MLTLKNMKSFYTKLFLSAAIIIFISALVTNIFSSSGGITGMTRKNGGIGCVCHGLHAPDTTVHVFFTGPDSVAVNSVNYFRLKIVGGPHIKGGLDVAVGHGSLDTTNQDTTIRK